MKNKAKTYALILAAGKGTRLHSLTQHYPKPLIKVNGREILDYQIKGYIKAGIKEKNIFVVTGYKRKMIAEFLAKKYPCVREIYNPHYQNTNNMYSLYLGLKELKNKNLQCLLINNADCLYEESLMSEFINSTHSNTIAIKLQGYNDESMKVMSKNGYLTHIAKTIPENKALGLSVDLYKFSKQGIKVLFDIVEEFIEIKKDLKQWSEVAFPQLFKKVKVYPHDIKETKWVEVDNEIDLAEADRLFSTFDIKDKKALICDMDGTLYIGNNPIQESIDFIKNNKNLEFYFLTNNSSKNPSDYVKKLNSFGIKTDEKHILTPLKALIDYITTKKYTSIYLVANERVENFLKLSLPKTSFKFDKASNQAVVLTYDTEINYLKFTNICELLSRKNVEYIATHEDIFCPCEFGKIPDIGSFIALVKAVILRVPDVVLGKPSLNLVKEILARYNKYEIAVVGDRLYTDKKLADNVGCDFVCVLTGETTRLDIQKYQGTYPSLVVKNLKFA